MKDESLLELKKKFIKDTMQNLLMIILFKMEKNGNDNRI